jgi:hypothetical protein
LITAAPAEISELMAVGVGLGVGVGVGAGGGGGGTNAPCAWAEVDSEATATVSANATATARTNLRPTAVCHARKGRGEQRINAIPKNSASPAKKAKSAAAGIDLPPVRLERQSVMASRGGQLPDAVVALPQYGWR